MKNIIISVCAVLFVTACNNNEKSTNENEAVKTDTTKMSNADTTKTVEVAHSFSAVDAKLLGEIKAIVDDYLHIKNALVNNSGSEAASGGKAMGDDMNKIDKSLFTAEQKKVYDGIEDDLKENAEHIHESADKIDHQREHFSMMSEEVYDLVKAFGGGQTLYHDHCRMANDNKGAMWLSETKEIHNPYFKEKMDKCVSIPEVIR